MKIKMVENIMQFLKSISIMFLINLLVFYFLGFEYLNNQLFIILAIIYILILLTYRKSYRLNNSLETFEDRCIKTFFVLSLYRLER